MESGRKTSISEKCARLIRRYGFAVVFLFFMFADSDLKSGDLQGGRRFLWIGFFAFTLYAELSGSREDQKPLSRGARILSGLLFVAIFAYKIWTTF